MKDDMFVVAGEITVVGKLLHETFMRGVEKTSELTFINDSNRVNNKGLQYQDCEVLFHVNKQSPTLQVVCTSARMLRKSLSRQSGGRTHCEAAHCGV